ncbi:MAG: DUF2177 family protein [Rhodospirillales bacterium]|nr:DUF2177 family protein [Rhodospirillales bacterium]
MRHLVAYAAAAVVFLGLDFVWLGLVAKSAYRSWIGHLMRDEIHAVAAVLFYLVYVVGLVIFAIAPALKDAAWQTAALYGALFGFFAYGTYELTNYATLKDWPFAMVAVDMAWGTALSAVAATAGYAAARQFG